MLPTVYGFQMRGGEYLEFVANRVRKIKEHKVDACCLLPTIQQILEVEVARLKTQNCGGKVRNGCLIVISGHLILRPKKVPNSSRSQIKVIREVVVVATIPEADEFDDLLAKYDLDQKSLERILGMYLIYIPDDCEFAAKLFERAYRTSLHDGLGLTIAKIREEYWIPLLR